MRFLKKGSRRLRGSRFRVLSPSAQTASGAGVGSSGGVSIEAPMGIRCRFILVLRVVAFILSNLAARLWRPPVSTSAIRINSASNRCTSRCRFRSVEPSFPSDSIRLIKAPAKIKLPSFEEKIDFYREVRNFEIYLIKRALKQTAGSQVKASNLLRLDSTTLNKKLKSYKIGRQDKADL